MDSGDVLRDSLNLLKKLRINLNVFKNNLFLFFKGVLVDNEILVKIFLESVIVGIVIDVD